MITIRISFHLLEELRTLCNVELGTGLRSKRQDCDVHIAVQSPLLPCLPIISLNAVLGPIPAVLTLNNA